MSSQTLERPDATQDGVPPYTGMWACLMYKNDGKSHNEHALAIRNAVNCPLTEANAKATTVMENKSAPILIEKKPPCEESAEKIGVLGFKAIVIPEIEL